MNVFSWGDAGGRESARARSAGSQTIMKGVLDPRLPWADRALFQDSTTRRPSPHIEDGEGDTDPRSTTDSTEQWV